MYSVEMATESRALRELSELLTKRERRTLDALTSPTKIQAYLDATPYSTEPIYRAPLTVLRQRRAHCFDGATFAAMALARLGHPPRLLDMLPWDDDDHVLAIYQRGPRFGAIAKSNFTGLRGREPVYRSLRELLMSYFEPFFNLARNRTLRGYTRPLSLRRYDRAGWTHRDRTMDQIADGLDAAPKQTLFSPAEVRAFTKVDELTVHSNLWNADPKGLRKPKNR
jgi:hypothetical protein